MSHCLTTHGLIVRNPLLFLLSPLSLRLVHAPTDHPNRQKDADRGPREASDPLTGSSLIQPHLQRPSLAPPLPGHGRGKGDVKEGQRRLCGKHEKKSSIPPFFENQAFVSAIHWAIELVRFVFMSFLGSTTLAHNMLISR